MVRDDELTIRFYWLTTFLLSQYVSSALEVFTRMRYMK